MPAKDTPAKRTRGGPPQTRTLIVEAAFTRFAEVGYAAARVEDIAARAGVAKGTIYVHFKTKEALFEAIVRDTLVPAVSGLLAAQAGANETTRDFAGRVMLPFLAQVLSGSGPAAIRLILAEGSRFPSLAAVYFRAVIEPGLGFMRGLARRGLERGEAAHPDLARFPHLVVAPALLGILWTGLFDRFEPLDLEAMLRTHLDLLFPPNAVGTESRRNPDGVS